MSEAKASSVKSTIGGWIKAVLLSIGGLVSGAVVMYVSPLVERVVKPSKPLANFAHEVQGTQITFQDRSNGSDGWWDFGDGSALEPYLPEQKSIAHTYPRPGGYTAKLVVRNFLREENERAVSIQIDGSGPSGVSIDALTALPLQSESYAPATFKIAAKVNHAEQCIWACGAEHPIEVVFDPSGQPERYVTFKQPGQYIVRLAAIQGKTVVQKEVTVRVASPPPGMAMAVLNVAQEAVRVEKVFRPQNIRIDFPEQHKEPIFKFSREINAWSDCIIVKASLGKGAESPFVKNAKVEVTKDGKKAIVTGELHRPATPPTNGPALPMWVVEVLLNNERTGAPQHRPRDAVAVPLQLPGATLVPLPALQPGWVLKQRQMDLNLMEGQRLVWDQPGLPKNASVSLRGQFWRITATDAGNQLRIDAAPGGGLGPVGN